ncbi:Fur family transcriptional regulator [Rothia sp. P6271]|uniref:Fur family transcriptional regulator n=1 Tax=unclassified Rothia (in: high G+C Gram-positive bacteria) TaxID=2689056 RepID=UPI003AC554A2
MMAESQTAKPEVRNTKQRRIVKATLEGLDDFISAQELHMLMVSRQESVSLATTYRILQSLAEYGEVDVLKTEDGESIYRKCEVEHHHHHLLCRRCGAAVELEAPSIEDWATAVGAQYGYTDIDHVIEVTGVCSSCQKKDLP